MPYSVFDLYKIGIGPSSSHTVGPMLAARRFLKKLQKVGLLDHTARIVTRLYGSLALTGKGHNSDVAIMLGLSGEEPDSVDPSAIDGIIAHIRETKILNLLGKREIQFEEKTDLVFDYDEVLPAHSNGMCFYAYDAADDILLHEVFYSIGGGFVVGDDEVKRNKLAAAVSVKLPFDYCSAEHLLALGRRYKKTIVEMVFANELTWRQESQVNEGLDYIWATMSECMDRGMHSEGQLPGSLKVRRRAKKLHDELCQDKHKKEKMPHSCMDWISLYAIAVAEENASGGRIVTAPTNGAAGVIPATIRYYKEFCPGASQEGIREFLLTATAIGILIKLNASISGAEAGCQGEVGSACGMAAGGLAAALGGTNTQIENAAEIGLEHHLGMSCDPVEGLVQIPCIERNAMGAVKAINAASLALHGDGTHFVSLDAVIETMRQTGEDMASKYKETSKGGLAVNVVVC